LDGKTDNPNTPTSLAAVTGIKSAKLTWVNPVAKDIGLIRVYRNTTNSSGTAAQIGSVYGEAFSDNGLLDSTLYYYWVKSEDTSGNLSSFSSPTSVTTLVGANGDSVDIIFRRSATQPAGIGVATVGNVPSPISNSHSSGKVELNQSSKIKVITLQCGKCTCADRPHIASTISTS